MSTVTVLTDSVACLSPELRSRLGIGMVGICITLDGQLYHDGIDLRTEEFYARMGEAISHKTASPSVGDWLAVMQTAVDAGAGGLLVVTLAHRFSNTYDSARSAAKLVSVPAVVVDSRTVAAAQGLYVRRLAEDAAAGVTLDALVQRAHDRRGCYRLEFVLEGLSRVAATGRLPSTVARLGDAVEVKPMLTLGPRAEMRAIGVARGTRSGIERIYRRLLKVFPEATPGRVVVSHALMEDDAIGLADRLRSDRPELDVEVALFTPVMVASVGPIIGVAWEDPALIAER
ncbi:MAG: DegV family protein [Mycobacterium sp.]